MQFFDIRHLYKILSHDTSAKSKFKIVRKYSLITLALVFVAESLSILSAYPLKNLLDSFNKNDPEVFEMAKIAAFVLFIATMHTSAHLVMDFYRNKAMYPNFGYLIGYIHEHQFNREEAWHNAHSTGEKDSVLTTNMKKIDYLIDIVAFDVIPTIAQIILISLALLLIGPMYTVLALTTVASFVIVAGKLEKSFKPHRIEAHEKEKKFRNFGAEQINGTKMIKDFGVTKRESERYRESVDAFTLTETKRRKIRARHWFLQGSIVNFAGFVLYGMVIWQIANHNLSVGTVALLIAWFAKMHADLHRICNFQREIDEGLQGLEEILKMLRTPNEMISSENPIRVDDLEPCIQFDSVSFRYNQSDEFALRDITLKVQAGQFIGVMGISGSGKTTMMQLLLHAFDTTEGTLQIGGIPITEIDHIQYLQDFVAIIHQTPTLFDGTIRHNICFARPDATDEEVIAAAKMANAHDFILGFEKGYETELGEDGVRLSGGEKQRIAIARALIKTDAKLLIMDEGTSSLDELSQAIVKDNIDKLDKTKIVIAHRFSTITNADMILLLDKGKLSDYGTIKELERRSPLFRRLRGLEEFGNE